jgi:hypothetical protein
LKCEVKVRRNNHARALRGQRRFSHS